jgi:hypothetical protein
MPGASNRGGSEGHVEGWRFTLSSTLATSHVGSILESPDT